MQFFISGQQFLIGGLEFLLSGLLVLGRCLELSFGALQRSLQIGNARDRFPGRIELVALARGASRLGFLKENKHRARLVQLRGQWLDFEIDGLAASSSRQWYSGISDGLLLLGRPAKRAGQR